MIKTPNDKYQLNIIIQTIFTIDVNINMTDKIFDESIHKWIFTFIIACRYNEQCIW